LKNDVLGLRFEVRSQKLYVIPPESSMYRLWCSVQGLLHVHDLHHRVEIYVVHAHHAVTLQSFRMEITVQNLGFKVKALRFRICNPRLKV